MSSRNSYQRRTLIPRRVALLAGAVATSLLATFAPAVVPAASAASGDVIFQSGKGIQVDSVSRTDKRLYDLTISTSALGSPVHVRILLPDGYAGAASRRYPTLYLYTGTGGKAADWTQDGQAEQLTAHQPLIVVMPDVMPQVPSGIGSSWFSDWVDQSTTLGASKWETFEIGQLVPWIDTNLRTRATRDGRAVAGLSQGGFGSMLYATRHPDMFVSAASLSGAVDTAYGPVGALGHLFVLSSTAAAGVPADAVFGSPITNEINWQGHDPTTLVTNLKGMDVWLFTGNGKPGPFDTSLSPLQLAETGAIEGLAHLLTHAMAGHATQTGVRLHLVDYGPGTHSWPYWTRDLRWYLPRIMLDFTTQPAAPTPMSFRSIDADWTQWGWGVRLSRQPALQFSSLSAATMGGFLLQGSGSATVRTPPYYSPSQRLKVAISSASGTTQQILRADGHGRLLIHVPLSADGSSIALSRVAIVSARA